MSIYLRGGVWWFEFIYRGRRIQESAGTPSKTMAREVEKERRKALERAAAGLPSEEASDRIKSVSELLKAYRQSYGVNHRTKSVVSVDGRSAHLQRLLGTALLSDVKHETAIAYMSKRQKEGASARTINMELQVLSRAIGYPWRALWPKLKPLEENHDIGRALEISEEQALMAAAAANKSSIMIHPYLFILAWTGMRSDEARTLRWRQVNFERAEMIVGKAKTAAGEGRRIPMAANLKAILEQYASYYSSKFGLLQPEWYVFCKCKTKRPVDPLQPVTSLKKAWETARTDAGVDCRLHDFRHTFCTKLAEAGVPESTMLDMMGHVSTAMLRRYSHIRARARRDAIDALETRQNLFQVSTKVPTVEGVPAVAKSVSN